MAASGLAVIFWYQWLLWPRTKRILPSLHPYGGIHVNDYLSTVPTTPSSYAPIVCPAWLGSHLSPCGAPSPAQSPSLSGRSPPVWARCVGSCRYQPRSSGDRGPVLHLRWCSILSWL